MDVQNLKERLTEYLETTGVTQKGFAKKAGISNSSVNQFLHDQYDANTENIASLIETALNRESEKKSITRLKPIFVETSVWKHFHEIARICHLDGVFGVVVGDSGIGKTTSSKEYCRIYKDAILIETDGGYSPRVVAQKIYNILCTGDCKTIDGMCDQIIEKLIDSGRIIIIDEAENLKTNSLQLLRRICDKSGAAMLMVGMPLLLGNLRGRQGQFPQLYGRAIIKVKLSNINLDDAKAIVETIIPKPEKIIKKFYEKAKGNTRALWHIARISARVAMLNKVEIEDDVINVACENMML